MPTSFPKGLLIAVEGIDGVGKTTQVEELREALTRAGEVPVVSKEPTDGPWGRKIKESAANGRMPLDEELAAFIRDRTDHVNALVLPALSAGRIVILDRYFYSTIAYQGSRGADVLAIEREMEARFPVPDIVFIIDLDPAISLHRIHDLRKDTPNEFEKLDSLRKAAAIFRGLRGPHLSILNGMLSISALHAAILDVLIEGPLKAKRCVKSYGCDDPFHCSFRLSNSCDWIKLSQALASTLPDPVTPGLRGE